MTSITQAVRRLKQRLPEFLAPELITALCLKCSCGFRVRTLTPVLIVQLLVLRVLCGNTAYSHLPHLAQVNFTASAFCQALRKLPLELLQMLLGSLSGACGQDPSAQERLFFGHRVLLADGLCVSMPDTPQLREHFGYPAGQKPGLGFPIAKLLMLLDVSTGLIRRVVMNPYRTHEASQVVKVHPDLMPGDILVADRGFCSFVHLALLMAQNCHALFRAHQRLAWDFTAQVKYKALSLQALIVRSLGRDDRLVVYRKPKGRPLWMSPEDFAAMPEEITVRELRYHVHQAGFRSRRIMLVTTLLDAHTYPRDELARLYGLRWRIETNFKHLKTTLGMAVLKGKSVPIIEREILAYVLVFNLLQSEIRRAAAAQHVAPERIGFLDAVRWLLAGMRRDTPLLINPQRPDRVEPRVRKRRPPTYPLMTRTRSALRAQLMAATTQ